MLRKYQKVEKYEIASHESHESIGENLRRLGKTSASELTDEEREAALKPE